MHWQCTPVRQQQLAGLVFRQVDRPEAARSKERAASKAASGKEQSRLTQRLDCSMPVSIGNFAKPNFTIFIRVISVPGGSHLSTQSHLSERTNQAPECLPYIRQSSAGVPCGIYVRLLVCLQCNPSHLVLHRAEDVCVTVVVTRLNIAHHKVLKPDTALLL